MALPADKLRQDLISFFSQRDRGAPADLARQAGVSPATLSNLTRKDRFQRQVSYETWRKLHKAAPQQIRHPRTGLNSELSDSLDRLQGEGEVGCFLAETLGSLAGDQIKPAGADRLVYLPIYHGEGVAAGGPALDCLALPRRLTGREAFAISAPDDSMNPALAQGGLAVVDPRKSARPGDMVLVVREPGRGGAVLRWFYPSGEITRLRPENPEYAEELLGPPAEVKALVQPVVLLIQPPRRGRA